MNDQQLAELCKRGDNNAFEELIERYYTPLYRFFYKHLHEPAICEDLTHDTVLKLIENIDKYRPFWGAKFSTWLFKLAYNAYADHIKKAVRMMDKVLDESTRPPELEDNLHDRVAGKLDAELVRSEIDKLPEEMKSLIILRYYQGFGHSEIGKIIGISPKKVKWKLHNSLDMLRKRLRTMEVKDND